jgi:TonB family protein
MPAPKYPAEALAAKIGGAVEVFVNVDETGKVTAIEKIEGPQALQGAAREVAMKARFAPALCESRPVRISGVLSYNFIPHSPDERYFAAESIDAFKDVSKNSPYYEAILDLTDNYHVTFGYGDGNYYPDLPMSRGEFAHSLRLTLDFLKRQAAAAKVDPRNAYRDANPLKLPIDGKVESENPKSAYADSLAALLRDYNVSLFDSKNEFDGRATIRCGGLIAIWKQIFGDDAIPVNFDAVENENRVLSRGEFALFLQESMRILTYKLLPVN